MRITNAVQQRILRDLIHAPELSFNQLWRKAGDSNKFAYHVARLVTQGLVKKSLHSYSLTDEGKAYSAYLGSATGEETKFPTLAHITIIRHGAKLLVQERLKEPFRGYYTFISGKISFGISLADAVSCDVLSETGLVVTDLAHRGIEEIFTYEKEKLLFHHVLHIVEVRVRSDGIIKPTVPGKNNHWLTLVAFEAKKRFPEIALRELLDMKNNFVIAYGKRFMTNGEFTHAEIIRKEIF